MLTSSHIRSLLAALLLAGYCGWASAATTYFVASTGLDTNTGASGSPFREIRKAVSVVHAGDTVLVADGQYKGFTIDSLNGSSASPITIQAQGSGAIVNITTDRSINQDTIFVTFCTYIIIDGFHSSNATRAAVRVDNSQHITIRNGVFGTNTTWGIFTDFSDDLLLENNECFGSVQQHGIYVSNTCTRPTVRGNRLHDNFANGLHMNGDVSQGGVGLITNALVENNVIYANGAGGGSGINCDGVQNSVFRNNLIYAAKGAGITLYQTDASGPSINDTVINNTIDIASTGKWAIQIHNGSSGAVVFNNIFLTHNTARGSIHLTEPADQTGLVCDYNVLTTQSHVATPDDDNTDLTFTQWQALGYDAHSIQKTQDDLFINWSGGDFHLNAASPAQDIGIATLSGKIAPVADIENHSRPQGSKYDLGAYETLVSGGGGGNTPPSITSGPTATPNPAAVNQSVSFAVVASDTDPLTYSWNFGDGSPAGTGATPMHTYAAAGSYSVTVSVSDGTNTVASSLLMSVTTNGGGGGGGGSNPPSQTSVVGSGPDSDGDGFSDSFESSVQTDPASAASTPTGQPITAGALQALTVTKASIHLNFASTAKDTIQFSGNTAVPAGFIVKDTKVYFDVGGVSKVLTLLANGSAKSGNDTFKLTVRAKKGVVAAQTSKYTATFRKGTFAPALALAGLANTDAKKAPETVTFTLIFNGTVLQKAQPMLYTAKKGKTGSAK